MPENNTTSRSRRANDHDHAEIYRRINNLETTVALRESKMDDVEKLKKATWGENGNIGMVGRLSKMEDIISDIKRLLWAILAVVLGIAIGGIWQAIEHSIVVSAGGVP